MTKQIVVIESPYKASYEFELQRNLSYARALCEWAVLAGFVPYQSHLSITQALDDRNPEHRALGISCQIAMLSVASKHFVGIDLGVTDGMQEAIDRSPLLVERISLQEWRDAVSSSTDGTMRGWSPALNALVEKYAPKWHAHNVKMEGG